MNRDPEHITLKVMRAAPASLAMFLAFTFGCQVAGPNGKPVVDKHWEGDVRILPGDTSFVECGTTVPMRLTGPGADSIAQHYTQLSTLPGQWIKTWCSGQMVLPGPGLDSVLQASHYLRMDSSVNCIPVPNEHMAGKYVSISVGQTGLITEQNLLLQGGDAVSSITAPNAPLTEDDGNWGIDANGDLVVQLPERKAKLTFMWEKGGLRSKLPNGAPGPTYRLAGHADRMDGTFGRTATWLAAMAKDQGDTLRAENLRPSMALDSLFPRPAARAALRASAADTLGMTEQELDRVWNAARTVKDVNALLRSHFREVR